MRFTADYIELTPQERLVAPGLPPVVTYENSALLLDSTARYLRAESIKYWHDFEQAAKEEGLHMALKDAGVSWEPEKLWLLSRMVISLSQITDPWLPEV